MWDSLYELCAMLTLLCYKRMSSLFFPEKTGYVECNYCAAIMGYKYINRPDIY